jgi:uncharacterized protein YutE (UPF0331/DUF86 family)
MDDITINKTTIIRRCLVRIAEEFQGNADRLTISTVQDSVVLNLLRACEAAIDLAMHQVAVQHLGIPQNSRDAFDLLSANHIISEASAASMKRMVGFRNIAVHDYQRMQIEILEAILTQHLSDFDVYLRELERH